LRVQGLGRFDDLLETRLALRKALRLGIQVIYWGQVVLLLLFSAIIRAFSASLTADSN
jgi:hypothetical protein